MTAQPMVKAEGVHKSFGPAHILKGIDLEVAEGEVFCLIGPSGSGKSTFLRCINHLEQINAGRLYVDGELVGYRQKGDKLYELKDSEVALKRRDIGMVFQRFNLFPHMTAVPGAKRHGDRAVRQHGSHRGDRPGRQVADRAPAPRRHRPEASAHASEHEVDRHRTEGPAVHDLVVGVVAEHPPPALAQLHEPLDDEQILLQRVPQHGHVADPQLRAVVHEQLIPVQQRGNHRGPEDLRDPQRHPRLPPLIRHTSPTSRPPAPRRRSHGTFRHESRGAPGLLT
ncbi:hypothetical protein SXANM310S_00966 [Streptomyces xanthochromogenes]